MKTSILCFLMIWLTPPGALANACPSETASALLKDARQLLLVTAPGWNSHQARLRLFERRTLNERWRASGDWQKAVIGRSGLAWGFAYQELKKESQPLKHEGDGRSPAGVHRLATAFGFEPLPITPYRQLTPTTVCVDDPRSVFYNTIVEANEVPVDWASAEQMRSIAEYKLGLAVAYQSNRENRAGSCIFVHIWNGPQSGTAGCLAAPEATLAKLLKIIKPQAAIAFLPEEEMANWQGCFKGAAPLRTAPAPDFSY